MHQCEEFRERITEHIIDREDLAANAEFHHELLFCSACSEFYAESREMIDALSAVDLSISERQWNGIEHRLRMRLVNEQSVAAVYDRRKTGARRAPLQLLILFRDNRPRFRWVTHEAQRIPQDPHLKFSVVWLSQ